MRSSSSTWSSSDGKSLEEIAEELGLSNENDPLIVPYMIDLQVHGEGAGRKGICGRRA